MKFLFPDFLWALFLIAIPIIIHLFNFRKYKTLYFSDIRLLKEVKEETRKRSNLKHILILLARILTISALVFAFAQPYQPGEKGSLDQGDTIVSVFVDNSFSMQGEGTEGNLLEMARQMAIGIAERFDETTRFQLLSNEFAGYQQQLVDREEFINRLSETVIVPQSRTLPDIYRRMSEALASGEASNKLAFILSDFQSGMLAEDYPSDTINSLAAVVLRSETRGNIYVDSAWFESPVRRINDAEILRIRIVNTVDKAVTPSVVVDINGNKSPVTVSVQANSKTVAEYHFVNNAAGLQEGLITIRASDKQIRYDDSLYFTYNVLNSLSVLEITNNSGSPFTSIFGNDEAFIYKRVSDRSIELSELDAQNLIILNGLNSVPSGLASRLKAFADDGGSVAVFPGTEIDLASYGTFLSGIGANGYAYLDTTNMRVKSLNPDHVFFQNVFEEYNPDMNMPTSYSRYRITGSYASGEEALFTNFDNSVFLAHYPAGSGHVYVSSVPLDEQFSNFVKHGLFVPAVLRMAELSYPANELYYTIGSDRFPTIRNDDYNSEITFHLTRGEKDIIALDDRTKPGVIGLLTAYGADEALLDQAGIYELTHDSRTIADLAFNYNRSESEMRFEQDPDELETYFDGFAIGNFFVETPETIADAGESISRSEPTAYWKICLILALFFLATEIALIKLWRT